MSLSNANQTMIKKQKQKRNKKQLLFKKPIKKKKGKLG